MTQTQKEPTAVEHNKSFERERRATKEGEKSDIAGKERSALRGKDKAFNGE